MRLTPLSSLGGTFSRRDLMAPAAIPKLIHCTAPGPLSWEEERLVTRMRRLHPGWTVRVWSDAENEDLVRQCFPQHLSSYRAIQLSVIRADIARCAYMAIHGGFYLDTDVKLFRPIPADQAGCVLPLEGGTAGMLAKEDPLEAGFYVGNAVMGSTAGHPFWGAMIEEIFSRSPERETDRWEVPGLSGPWRLTHFIIENRNRFEGMSFPDPPAFYPKPRLLDGYGPETVGVHLCWGSWRNKQGLQLVRTLLRRKLNALI